MKLIELELKNFKGVKEFTLRPNGHDATVYGENASGKTTLFDAFLWLLFDKDSQGKKDFEIKTLNPEGEALHNLDHSVRAIVQVENGKEIEMQKVYREKWTKQRGSATREFTGHTTEYYVDGVPVKKKEYQAQVAEIADEEVFKLLTNPLYFNEQLHWAKRRELLLQVCGDVSDEDVIASSKELAELPEILGNRSLEDHKKVIASKRKEINRELERIPVRIDEVAGSMPEKPEADRKGLDRAITDERTALQGKEDELARLRSGGQVAEKTVGLREVEAELLGIKAQSQERIQAKTWSLQDERWKLEARAEEIKAEIAGMGREIEQNKEAADRHERLMQKLRKQWEEVDAREFDLPLEEVCPTCGQSIPAEDLDKARADALERFNADKADRLEEITAEGKSLSCEKQEVEDRNRKLRAEITALENEKSALDPKIQALIDRIEKESKSAGAWQDDPEYKAKEQERQRLEAEIEALRVDSSEQVEAVTAEIAAIQERIASLQKHMAAFNQIERAELRIAELSEQEKKLAAEFERLEKEMYLTEQFTRQKVEMLEEKINSKFEMVRFRLFTEQINGGLTEVCETTVNGVPYSSLNRGARIRGGLDIINTLAEHYGFRPVVWLDNREALSGRVSSPAQTISLVVSEEDPALRVTYTENKKAA